MLKQIWMRKLQASSSSMEEAPKIQSFLLFYNLSFGLLSSRGHEFCDLAWGRAYFV